MVIDLVYSRDRQLFLQIAKKIDHLIKKNRPNPISYDYIKWSSFDISLVF